MRLHDTSRCILERGLALCVVLMAVAVLLLAQGLEGGAAAKRFLEYAGAFHFSAQVAFACAAGGCAAAEDILRYFGE